MDIADSKHGDITLLSLTGSIDTRSTHELEQKVQELLGGGARRFVIDFQRVDQVTSSGLRVMLMLAKKLEGTGGLALCALSEHVKTVFEISGLARYFLIVPSKQEAFERLPEAQKVSKVTNLVGQVLSGGKSPAKRETPGARGHSRLSNVVAQLLSRPSAGPGGKDRPKDGGSPVERSKAKRSEPP